MKNFSNSFSEKITRKNFFGKFWFCFSTIGIDFSFENKNFAMAENLEKNSLAFSTKSGLKIIDFLPGEAQMPQWGDFVIINYVLYKNSSQKIEKISDTYQKNTPFLFIHGGGQTIKGLEEAVHSMKKGGKRRVVIPQELGYNVPGLGPIPPENSKRKKLLSQEELENKSSNIILDIELVDIRKNDKKQKLFRPTSFSKTKE
mmetsp:Transcript_49465/g.118578  ORF Transcript_49465/g.118578 Transcript_49465/m.118578 type:complete len:201 (+) Transcript_49465:167-769(+)